MILEPILDEKNQTNYLQVKINPFLMDGIYELSKLRPEEPIIWLSNWLIQHNPYKPVTTNAKLNESNSNEICSCHTPIYSGGLMKSVAKMSNLSNDSKSTCSCSYSSPGTICSSGGTVETLFESDNFSCHSFVTLSDGLEKIVHCPVCNKSIIIKLNLIRSKEDSKMSGNKTIENKVSEISSSNDDCECGCKDEII